MADLLLHSMSEFADIVLDALALADARDIVEIGAEHGGMSQRLAAYAQARGGRLTSIDPAPQPAFVEWAAGQDHVTHIAAPSLAALGGIAGADAWLIDGDHNWFTVYHEIGAIDRIARASGRPLLAFFHDVGWPAGRRDQYYAPAQIPPAYRHAFDFEGGVVPGVAGTLPGRGFRGMGHFAWARHEGGARNGVMTAIEDFLTDVHAAGRDLAFAEVPAVFGLGVLFDSQAPWSEALGRMLLPVHENALLATLERNRLANYLRVIELQDELATRPPPPLGAAA